MQKKAIAFAAAACSLALALTAIRDNKDILSTSMAFVRSENRIRIRETDTGHALQQTIDDPKELLAASRRGEIKEDNADGAVVRSPIS